MISVRDMLPSDRKCVIDNIVDSYRLSHSAGLIQMNTWRDVMEHQADLLISRPGAVVKVAFETTAPPELDIYGWAAAEFHEGELPLVLYVYVKQNYREEGIARMLLGRLGIDPKKDSFYFGAKTGIVARLTALGKLPFARFRTHRVRFPYSREGWREDEARTQVRE